MAKRRQDYTDASIFNSPNTSQLAEINRAAGDRILFYDQSQKVITQMEVGSGLSIAGTTLSGTGAPSTADFLVKTADAGLGAERVVTDTPTVTWDWSTAGQAKANATGGTSGTYTPTLTNTTNIASSTAFVCQYMQVGTFVTVSGKVTIDPTTAGIETVLGISIPVASNFNAEEQCAGTAVWNNLGNNAGGAIRADTTNDRATLRFSPASDASFNWFFIFGYQVI